MILNKSQLCMAIFGYLEHIISISDFNPNLNVALV